MNNKQQEQFCSGAGKVVAFKPPRPTGVRCEVCNRYLTPQSIDVEPMSKWGEYIYKVPPHKPQGYKIKSKKKPKKEQHIRRR